MHGVKPAALLLILLLVAWVAPPAFGEQRTRYLYTSIYTFENRGNRAYNITEDDATILLFRNESWQTVWILNSSVRIAREYLDIDGNKMAVLDLPATVSPNSNLSFSVTYEIEATNRPKPGIDTAKAGKLSDIPPDLVKELTSDTETFTTKDQEILKLAKKLAAGETTVLGISTRFLEWFVGNITYSNFEVPRYPNETLVERRGDCDDQSLLLITMLRAVGVPAILQVGVVFDESIEGEKTSWGDHLISRQKGIGWHGWVMVYVPPWGWLPIDLTIISSKDPLSRITEAPEYSDYIVSCLNVSRQDYVGDSRRARGELMSSQFYVTTSDVGMRIEDSSGSAPLPYAVIGFSAGAAAMIIVILVIRRRIHAAGKNIF